MKTSAMITFAALLLGRVAEAAEPDAADAAFRRGIALMESGAVTEACVAFEESERLESKAGTLLNLAGCYERASRWADAYRTFERARDAARARQRADWETVASEHMATLKPKIARVMVDASSMTGLADARVLVDGRAVDDEELRRGLVLVPGSHVIRGEASGYVPFEQTLTTPPDARVKIMPLERVAGSTRPTDLPGAATAETSGTRKTVGLVLGATGIAALAFGAVSGLVASSALSEAKSACSSYPDRCTPAAAEPNDRATTWSTLGTLGLASGAALVVVGIVTYVWPSSRAGSAITTARPGASRPAVTLGPAGSGLGLTF